MLDKNARDVLAHLGLSEVHVLHCTLWAGLPPSWWVFESLPAPLADLLRQPGRWRKERSAWAALQRACDRWRAAG